MNKIPYEQIRQVYTKALIAFGLDKQLIVALEELSECQEEICKLLRGGGDIQHLAEEVADATIMLEQVRTFYPINGMVCEKMDEKILRLEERIKEVRDFETRKETHQKSENLHPQQAAESR